MEIVENIWQCILSELNLESFKFLECCLLKKITFRVKLGRVASFCADPGQIHDVNLCYFFPGFLLQSSGEFPLCHLNFKRCLVAAFSCSKMEQFDQLLTCCICLDRFRNPKLLPCQHSYCMEPCMEGLVDYVKRQVKCPECRAEHRIPYNGIQGFPSNITLQKFLELHAEITGKLSTGLYLIKPMQNSMRLQNFTGSFADHNSKRIWKISIFGSTSQLLRWFVIGIKSQNINVKAK